MEAGSQSSSSSMPLVSRLDHLDFLMKYLERKQSLAVWSSSSLAQGLERQCVPLDLAAKEADFKGSLLDRVASLEHRLFQLCLGKQSSGTSSSSSSRASTQTPGDTCSSHGFKGGPSFTFRTFNNAIHGDKLLPHVGVDRLEIQEEKPHRHRVAKELKIASAPRQRHGNNGKLKNKEEKTCKSRKKGISPNWPRLNILGC